MPASVDHRETDDFERSSSTDRSKEGIYTVWTQIFFCLGMIVGVLVGGVCFGIGGIRGSLEMHGFC